jgi:hypothetical protein
MKEDEFKVRPRKYADGYVLRGMHYDHVKALDVGLSEAIDRTNKRLSDETLDPDVRKMYEDQRAAAYELLNAVVTIRRGDLEKDAKWEDD